MKLIITAYVLDDAPDYGVVIERCIQRDGTITWAVRDGADCLNKNTFAFDYEPHPSNRTDDWLDEHRFCSAGAAYRAYLTRVGLPRTEA